MIDFGFGVKLCHLSEPETLNKHRNHPRVRRWCRQSDLIGSHEQIRWMEKIGKDDSVRMYDLITTAKGVDEKIGVCGLTSIDRVNSRAELSLYVFPDFMGYGYGLAGLKTLIKHAFKNQNLNSVYVEVIDFDNHPGKSLVTPLGLVYEGKRRKFYFKDGSYRDASLYSLMSDECSF